MASSSRGFTLIELMLGAVLVLIIASVAMGVLISVQNVQRDAQLRNAITRDAQFTLDTITEDLKYLGAGVPRGRQLYMAGGGQYLRPPIRIGEDEYIAFVGDAPYPNSDVNGLAIMQDTDEGDCHIAVSSEISLCAPPVGAPTTNGYTCATGANGLLHTGSAASCDFATPDVPTCPWGLGKWQSEFTLFPGVGFGPPVHLVLQSPSGSWVHRSFIEFHADSAEIPDVLQLHMDHSYPANSTKGIKCQVTKSDFIGLRAGLPTVAQVDRVFYSVEDNAGLSACNHAGDCVLRRKQCWGWGTSLDPDDGDFPNVGHAPILSSAPPADIASCAPPLEGTGWEPIMSGLADVTFRYFRSSNPDVEILPPMTLDKSDDVMFIEVEITIVRLVPGAKPTSPKGRLAQTFTRRVFLENGGGRFRDANNDGNNDESTANGGCNTKLTCGRDQ